MKFSLIIIYGSNVPSKPLSCYGINDLNERRSFIYTQLYIYIYIYIYNYTFNCHTGSTKNKMTETMRSIFKVYLR